MALLKLSALRGSALSALMLAAACSSTPADAPMAAANAAPAVAAAAAAAPTARAPGQTADANAPIAEGQKIVMATHSFNVFVGPTRSRDADVEPTPGPLAALAAERGKTGHETLAVQMIGGSTPMQHWNQGDGDDAKNIAKAALKAAGAELDVFTMSPNALMPEDGIDHFGDFVIAHNPNARIMVQNSWSGWDGNGTTPSVGGDRDAITFTNADRDNTTVEMIDGWLASLAAEDGYLERMRTQLDGIDTRAGRQITYVVPSAVAVYNLRKQVLWHNVQGVKLQSDLFRDPIGHPQTPTAHLVTYVWFAAMYRESPVGLKALVDASDPTSAPREELLQKLAWNAVVSEPKSGVKGAVTVVPTGPMVAAR